MTPAKLLRVGLALGATVLAVVLRIEPPQSVAVSTLEDRKQPMRFAWHDCDTNCKGWVSATGIVTAGTLASFDEFARGRDLTGATIVLDSSGGSVNDSLALGRRWRKLGAITSVGTTVGASSGTEAAVRGGAYCESMCVFLLLAGKTRYVPGDARVRVHQIWMGDRAEDARAASYTAQDLMIVERDIGRLAKYAFDMGATGDLLALALSIPPWENLHQMSHGELRAANLVTTDTQPAALPAIPAAIATLPPKITQDRLVSEEPHVLDAQVTTKATKTADAAGGPAHTVEK